MNILFKVIIGVFELIARLPMKFHYFVGNLVLILNLFPFNKVNKQITNNLYRIFPQYPPQKIKQIKKKTLKAFGNYAAEYVKVINNQAALSLKIANPDVLMEIVRHNKLTICLSGHFCGFEMLTQLPQHFKGIKFIFVYEQNDRVTILDEWVRRIRGRGGAELIPARKIMKAIHNHFREEPEEPVVVGCLSDLKPHKSMNSTSVVSFFGIDTSMYSGMERMGCKYGAKFLYGALSCERKGHYIIKFIEMAKQSREANLVTAEYAHNLEGNILAYPEGWIPLLLQRF